MATKSKIVWTAIDEAPALATYSLLPIVQKFTGVAGIAVEPADISLAGRIIANFPENLTESQRVPDMLSALGELAKKPEANIIKLPNVSASVPQLKAAIKELRDKGYNIPDFPENPQNEAEKNIKARYAKVLGSAVNPVLREGNSDRRAADAVKEYARKNPHKMGPWSRDSKTHVATMTGGDFCANEKSVTVDAPTNVRIEFVGKQGNTIVLKDRLALKAGEIIDGTFMSKRALTKFYVARPEAIVVMHENTESHKLKLDAEAVPDVLRDFIASGKANFKIVIGSPDPHGKYKARGSDSCCAIDLALFLGSFTNSVSAANYKLDTEMRENDYKQNLIVVGGPKANTVTEALNRALKVRMDESDDWNIVSKLSGHSYSEDDNGFIAITKNPWDETKKVIVFAGRRFPGTRATVIAFVKHFNEIMKGNKYDPRSSTKVVKGIDYDGDGVVDDVEFLE